MRESATAPLVAGGQGRDADEVEEAALNVWDLAVFALVLKAICTLLPAVALLVGLAGCATNLPRWGGM